LLLSIFNYLIMDTPKELHLEFKPVLPIDSDVAKLIAKLDQYQINLYGIEACNLEPPTSLIKNNAFMIGAFVNNILCGIGSIKFVDDYAEVKRMFVEEHCRGLAIAEKLLNILEQHAMQNGVTKLFLETGNLHHAAIKFYIKNGFKEIESFGKYQPNSVSVYFEKSLL
jgi:putative acetyltransferase